MYVMFVGSADSGKSRECHKCERPCQGKEARLAEPPFPTGPLTLMTLEGSPTDQLTKQT